MVAGGFEDVDGAVDVELVYFLGLFDALSNTGLGSLMVDNIGVGDEFVDGVFVGDRGVD